MEALERSNFKSMKNYVKNNFADCKAVAIISGNIVERDAVVTARNFFSKINMSGNGSSAMIFSKALTAYRNRKRSLSLQCSLSSTNGTVSKSVELDGDCASDVQSRKRHSRSLPNWSTFAYR